MSFKIDNNRILLLSTAIVAVAGAIFAYTYRYEIFYSDEKKQALAQESYGMAVNQLDSNPKAAAKQFAFAARLDPNNFNYSWQLALTQRKLGQLEKATDSFMKALEKKPGEPLMYVHLGETYEEMGSLGLAAQAYSNGIRSDSLSVQSYLHLAVVLNKMGQVDEAVKVLEDGLLKRPDSAEISNMLSFLKNG
jgi:tetratricopeptide (TPR) repeat protein